MDGAEGLKLEAELSSRSNQGGAMRIMEAVPGSSSADTPQRPRRERSAKRGDSKEIDLNEGVVESSMFKQVKFENGAAISQSGKPLSLGKQHLYLQLAV